MPDYKTMYKKLFGAVTEAIDILQKAQQETEEIYIESGEKDDSKIVGLKLVDKEEHHKN